MTAQPGPHEHMSVIVVAAGESQRFGGDLPKQWVKLAGKPVVAWALSVFQDHPLVDDITLVIQSKYRSRAQRLVKRDFPKVTAITSGGKTRAQSVRRGLTKVPDEAQIILIHDVARPLVPDRLIDDLVQVLNHFEAAIPVQLVGETLKRIQGDMVDGTVDRKGIAGAKTPQAFRAAVIRQAHASAKEDQFEATDDAVLVERMGLRVGIVHTNYPNVKITHPEDFYMIEALLRKAGGKPD